MPEALAAGSVIGILGGGQLGRMLALAAARLGLRCHVYEPSFPCPAAHACDAVTTAGYDDLDALRAFAAACDVVTYEFENVPAAALDLIESLVPIRPGRMALATSQDRLTEKTFLEEIGLGTAPFAPVETPAELAAALSRIGTPSILKTRRFGYDGKGQVWIRENADAAAALGSLNGAKAVLEGVVPFDSEISVIAARGQDGAFAAFTPGENVHRDGILRTTTVPASCDAEVVDRAVSMARRLADALDYVGVIGVEFFVTGRDLVINEFAPRVHNSGHWTQNGCVICQFEQHVRAVAGWPLGDGRRHSDVVMENLIGDDMDRLGDLRSEPVALHLYGKAETRPGRKMGHTNRIIGPAT